MAKQYPRSSSTTAELASDYSDQGDQEVMQALVTAGALVALADGRADAVERDELVNFIDRQQLVPTISQHDIAERRSRAAARKLRQCRLDCTGVSAARRPIIVVRCDSHRRAGRRGRSANSSRRVACSQADTTAPDDLIDQQANSGVSCR
jgi:tellurite resistance protein